MAGKFARFKVRTADGSYDLGIPKKDVEFVRFALTDGHSPSSG
ncbi:MULTISPECIES: hypothetical protein [unclassified Streptomyces]|nr:MULTISPECIES: hypothetical protein [unclassified Streptomyces]MCX4548695.1 hypothetical protein [Streptomyces sp. NBC_01500]WSC20298.1 hypothetical protein OIE60_11720 [Streptomyces sp. NBC_01766]